MIININKWEWNGHIFVDKKFVTLANLHQTSKYLPISGFFFKNCQMCQKKMFNMFKMFNKCKLNNQYIVSLKLVGDTLQKFTKIILLIKTLENAKNFVKFLIITCFAPFRCLKAKSLPSRLPSWPSWCCWSVGGQLDLCCCCCLTSCGTFVHDFIAASSFLAANNVS